MPDAVGGCSRALVPRTSPLFSLRTERAEELFVQGRYRLRALLRHLRILSLQRTN